ncbi:hypothetical protein D9M72_325140 [compost metagenome]
MDGGSCTCVTMLKLAPAGIGPVSGTPSPFVSSSGAPVSAAKNWKLVPAGKVLAEIDRFTASVAPPVLNTVCGNRTLPPATANCLVVRSCPAGFGVPGVASSAVAAVDGLEPTTMPKRARTVYADGLEVEPTVPINAAVTPAGAFAGL